MKNTILSLISLCLLASTSAMASDYYTGRGDAVIKGYDVVAYFKENKAVKGSPDFSYEYDGAVWRFASAENLNDFKAAPEQYIPQYNGYCAYAMSAFGDKVRINPKQFVVTDGKLYLNFNPGTSKKFSKDIDNHISQADKNWEKFSTH